MTWLVTGGAGYIGAHVARCLREDGLEVVVLDDLSSGHRQFVGDGASFVEGSITDPDVVRRTIAAHGVTGVVHLAGYKYAGESVRRPLHTYRQNLTGTQVLLEQMTESGVESLVFSSSASVYGTPSSEVVTEDTLTTPESPYGETKLASEWLIRDVGRVARLRHTSLRYFNVVGSGWSDVYDTSPHNLFPRVIEALEHGEAPSVWGVDYPTRDGSCVRDYVHVHDVALAHVAAARALESGTALEPAYNLGSGDGTTVLEILAAFQRVTGIDFEPVVADRRAGDPARIVAAGGLAARDVDWAMRHDVDAMVSSAWDARRGRVLSG
ncbi:MAG: UDP-glucose 4-epimerase [Actinomycetota bacterium]|jgi:UDP-glucose 4-epimerase|nr:UDP-glucose 4-epimerase [Actinomycetota bacterium]